MTITINGEQKQFSSDGFTVTELIQELEIGPQPVLVELNGKALYPREFDESRIEDGAKLEIIRMVAGG